jgi:hypothetical protein
MIANHPPLGVSRFNCARTIAAATALACASNVLAQGSCPVTFAPYYSVQLGGANPLAMGDFNRDGLIDFIGSQISTSSIGLRLANPNLPNQYQPGTTIPLGLNPSALVVGDFNHDNILDIAAGYSPGGAASAFVAILLGNGNGTFQNAVNYSVPGAAGKLVIADINGDGHPDIVQLSSQSVVSVLLGNASGTFQSPVTVASAPASTLWNAIALGDLNGDGRLDLLITGYVNPSAAAFIGVALGQAGAPYFGAVTTTSTGFFGGSAITTGHFNRDGKLDVAVLNSVSSGRPQIFLGDGNGGLTLSVSRSAGLNSQAIAVADFNLDGNLDLVVANQQLGTVSVFLGDGNGSLSTVGTTFAVSQSPSNILIGDLNNDGRPDIITGSGTQGDASVLLSTIPVLTFTVQPAPRGTCTGGSAPFSVTIAGQVTTPTFRWQIEDPPGNWIELGTTPTNLPGGGNAFLTGVLVTGQSATARVNLRLRTGNFNIRCLASSSCANGISSFARLHVGCDSIANIVTVGGEQTCDDELTADDVIAFLAGFFAQQPISDVARLGGGLGADGQWTADDVIAFLAAFFAGCP